MLLITIPYTLIKNKKEINIIISKKILAGSRRRELWPPKRTKIEYFYHSEAEVKKYLPE
jgi:hypothetical protein